MAYLCPVIADRFGQLPEFPPEPRLRPDCSGARPSCQGQRSRPVLLTSGERHPRPLGVAGVADPGRVAPLDAGSMVRLPHRTLADWTPDERDVDAWLARWAADGSAPEHAWGGTGTIVGGRTSVRWAMIEKAPSEG